MMTATHFDAFSHRPGWRHLLAVAVWLAVVLAAVPALALTLDEAKARGLLGETAEGYVASPLPSPDPEVQRLADQINLARKARYAEIAAREGTTLSVVERLAGAKLIAQAPPGQYVRDANGNWRRK